jgi:dipeptidyl aminopeptidase/acylaminoacyl peptidase
MTLKIWPLLFFPLVLMTLNGWSAPAETAAPKLSPADFAKLPRASNFQLSPDGKSIAYQLVYEGKAALITKALAKDTDIKTGALPLNGAHLQWFRWINNERLLVSIRMTAEEHVLRQPLYTVTVPRHSFSRVFSVDRSGLNPIYFDMEANKYGYRLSAAFLISMLKDDPEHVLLALDPVEDRFDRFKVHKVNVNTGKKTLVEDNRGGYSYFIADRHGKLRVAIKTGISSGTDIGIYTRPDEQSPFKLLQKKSFMDKELLSPVRFDYERDDVLILTSDELEDDDYDQDDDDLYELNIVTGEWLGPHVDKVRKNAKAVIEKAFKGPRAELRSWLNDVTLDLAIYEIYGDTHPPQYFLLNLKEKRLDFIASAYPELENIPLAKMKEVEYKARDGLTIPAYLSLPPSAEKVDKPKLPAIIFPHGGPWARDYWGFDNYVQFFASKGYAVFQPQFRGSTGFGYEHLRAGDKQWGLAIQDDITDGVHWLIKEEIIDPKKICIVGGSFGGYATAMGLAKTPDLYRCGVSINGVMDMKLFNRTVLGRNQYNRELTNPEWGIAKVSPYHLSKNIDDPMLIIYGEKDSVVDPKHSISMHKKLSRQVKGTELLKLPNGEHWISIEENEIKSFEAMDKFLSRYLN